MFLVKNDKIKPKTIVYFKIVVIFSLIYDFISINKNNILFRDERKKTN